ncbi:MAG: Unknown protein [uncultured Sulfurovum sp.]|uniref:Uncharacterized protein n=1 Tax=uncultured Sulfurovum sp. TaxID=269237 RepID=A0A6S6TWX0_9BACT|nr:MAG: Unknown protein [uncultured Sulfurovum sp.]
MNKKQKITLFFILILIFILYLFWNNSKNKEPIKIEPIKIAPIVIKELNSEKSDYKNESSEAILAKLKIATQLSQENIVRSKEEEQNEVLMNLKQTIAQQKVSLNKKMLSEKESQTSIDKPKVVVKASIPKKIVSPKESKAIMHKPKVIAKASIPKKIVSPKESKTIMHKPKVITKAPTHQTVLVNKEVNALQEIALIQKRVNQEMLYQPVSITEHTLPKESKYAKKLSREEEVALYQSTYANSLEVVTVSENFEIEEVDNHLPDSHYFEPIETAKMTELNAPLAFVEKLGVVAVSNKYESNFSIPQKIELAQEGIVNISSASLETQELKKLDFVDSLGVVEVSQDFETTQADSYLNN